MERTERNGAGESRREPVTIHNRDIPLLADLLSTMQMVRATEWRLEWQHDRMTGIGQRITGMPGGGSLPRGLDDAFAKLYESGEEFEGELRRYLKELRDAERILNGIASRNMQAFVVMKYVMDAPDAEIRRELGMTEWGFNRAKRAVEDAESMDSVVWREKYILAKPPAAE